ncbi:MAG: hypothetical protein D6724_05425 [Armatimonadetes bacterium]|nr:MAG: hypothetical protein D6724_05425 [Armatimonadota bacterium]
MIPSLLSALAVTAPVASGQAVDPAVLEQVRQAVGYSALSDLAPGVALEGAARFLGVDLRFSFLFDHEGRFVENLDGRLSSSQGYDGKTAWSKDWHGAVRKLEMEDLDSALLFASVVTHSWLSEKSKVRPVSTKREEGRINVELRIENSPMKATLTVDPTSHLPTGYVRETPAGGERFELLAWKRYRGVLLPSEMKQTEGGVENKYTVDQIGPLPTFVRSPFEAPPPDGSRVAFDSSKPNRLETKASLTGHILVKAKVNGNQEKWFIFDSGAGITVLDKKLADSLGLPSFGELPVLGVGGLVKAPFRPLPSLEIGPVTLKNVFAVEMDLGLFGTVFGPDFGGLIGYDLLARAVVEFDHANRFMALYDPSTYKLTGGNWLPLHLGSRLPVVEAKFEGNRDLFRLDTGAPNNVTFHSPAVEKYRLLENRSTSDTMMAGVGGVVRAKAGKLEYFEVGGRRIEGPTVTFAPAGNSAFDDPYLAGNLGTAFLDRFKVVFDYPHERIAFLDNSSN